MNKDEVLNLLSRVSIPGGGLLIESNRIDNILVQNNRITFSITIYDEKEKSLFEPICTICRDILKNSFTGDVFISLFHQKYMKNKNSEGGSRPNNNRIVIPSIQKLIAISSGKGGVGKSTTTLNLAVALARHGYRVGVLDADIYGPSIPMMIDHWQKPEINTENKMVPINKFGIWFQSIGFMIERNRPVLWRGPMAQSTFKKLLEGTAWPPLDFLLIDMPPGTGDVHLTMAQNVSMDGAIIVSTPQAIALIDAIKAIEMYKTLEVPVLGIVENMSHISCDNCGNVIDFFGPSGVLEVSSRFGISFLGHIPFYKNLARSSDAGIPMFSDNHISDAFDQVVNLIVN